MKVTIETEDEVREAFWEQVPHTEVFLRAQLRWQAGAGQNALPADVRMAFVDFVDYMQKSGEITEELASQVTL